jgi:2-hydroxychromene-2-carboxylate isomerase
MPMATALEFWFEFGSTYSYLSAARIEKVAKVVDLEIRWRPFLLGPIFADLGWNDSPFNLQPAKGRYMWRDMERLCAGYGLAFRRPSVFPRNGLLAARVACAGDDQGWLAEFVRGIYRANFAEDRDIADRAVVEDVLRAAGADASAAVAAAETAEAKKRLRAQTDRARELGIFGAPSFSVGDELFRGNDRLGDALSFARLGS